MEYKSNTTSKIRNKIPDYEMTINYVEPSHNIPAEQSVKTNMTKIIRVIMSCSPMFSISYVESRWKVTYNDRRMFDVIIGLSGGLPTAGAALWLSKITATAKRSIPSNAEYTIKLKCVRTGLKCYLLWTRETTINQARSSDIAAVRWTAIHNETGNMLHAMSIEERAAMFCRLFEIAKYSECIPWSADRSYGISDKIMHFTIQRCRHCIIVTVKSGYNYDKVRCEVSALDHFMPPSPIGEVVVCNAHGILPFGRCVEQDVLTVFLGAGVTPDGDMIFYAELLENDVYQHLSSFIGCGVLVAQNLITQARTFYKK